MSHAIRAFITFVGAFCVNWIIFAYLIQKCNPTNDNKNPCDGKIKNVTTNTFHATIAVTIIVAILPSLLSFIIKTAAPETRFVPFFFIFTLLFQLFSIPIAADAVRKNCSDKLCTMSGKFMGIF